MTSPNLSSPESSDTPVVDPMSLDSASVDSASVDSASVGATSEPASPDTTAADTTAADTSGADTTSLGFSAADTPEESLAPADRRPSLASQLLLGAVGLVLVGSGVWAWRFFGAQGEAPMGMMPPGIAVTLAPVETGLVRESSEFLGTLEALTGVVLQPEVSGRVTRVFVTAGDRVSPGQPVVLVSPDRTAAEFNAVAASVTAAQAAKDAAAATLQALKLRQAELEAELSLKKAEFERTEYLVSQGAQSKQELDVARRDREVAQASLNAALQDIAAAQAQLAQANAVLTQTQANQAAAAQNLQDRLVTAPIAGVIGDLSIKLGDYVTPDTAITTITENTTLVLELPVPVEQRDRLRLGLPIELLADDGSTVVGTGRVSFISPQAQADTQTVLVKAQLDNTQGQFQDAQQVEARIVWSESRGVLVPTASIARVGGQTFVYIAEMSPPAGESPADAPAADTPAPDGAMPAVSGPVARLRPVELGRIQGNDYEVVKGLAAGEAIVVTGILNLQDGMPILPQEAGSGSPETNP